MASIETKKKEKMKGKTIARTKMDAPHFIYKEKNVEVLVLGTAHVSQKSVDDVQEAFDSFKPDAVCVELCKPRFETLRDPDRWRKLNLSQLIRQRKIGLLASSLVLSSFQKRIGAKSGIMPGAEMMLAVELAEKKKRKLVLADREVRATLSRAWRRVGFFSRLWLISALATSILVSEDVDPEEIERLKNEDMLADLFSNLPARYASLIEVIIGERDQYLAQKIRETMQDLRAEKSSRKTRRILVVVGAGHLAGVQQSLESRETVDLEKLAKIPPPRRLKNILSWALVSVFAILIGYYFSERRPEDALKFFAFWSICRAAGSGIGALIAGAHPLTIVVTAATAPFSFFIIGSRLWMYSALTELWLRKPRVEDFENIAAETETLRGFIRSLYRNRVMNLFFVIFTVSTGLTLGNLVFGAEFLRRFFTGE